MTMTGSPSAPTNPSTNPSQPVPYRSVTRPPVPPALDGLAQPVTCGCSVWDGWTGSHPTRPNGPNPGRRPRFLTQRLNPSHPTTTHRSTRHVALGQSDAHNATEQPAHTAGHA
jgi:hypothetical protein